VRPLESPSRRGGAASGPAGETGATPHDSHGAPTATSPTATRAEVRGAPAPPRALPHPRRTLPAARGTAPAPDSSEAAPRRTAHIDTAPAPRRAQQPRRLPRTAGIAAGQDRLALWAVVLCLFMALVAAATARGHEPEAADQVAPAGVPVAEPSASRAPQR
jgi:hypothetical protein